MAAHEGARVSPLAVSVLVLWVVVALLAAVVFALVRQIGVLHQRIAPAGALMLAGGPKVGEAAPTVEVEDLTGVSHTIGGPHPQGRSTMIVFVSPTCPVCKTLLPAVRTARTAERDWLDFVLASDGDPAAQRRFVAEQRLEDVPYVVSSALGIAWQVGKLPYAVLVDGHGIVRARGLVNSREHLESLLHAAELGVASVQEYLERTRTAQSVPSERDNELA